MSTPKATDDHKGQEAARRRDEALKRALGMKPRPQKSKERAAGKGRVHKAKSRS